MQSCGLLESGQHKLHVTRAMEQHPWNWVKWVLPLQEAGQHRGQAISSHPKESQISSKNATDVARQATLREIAGYVWDRRGAVQILDGARWGAQVGHHHVVPHLVHTLHVKIIQKTETAEADHTWPE